MGDTKTIGEIMEFEIGLKCPSCSRVYQATFDTEQVFEVGRGCPGGCTTVHCPVCKSHPCLIIIVRYKMVEFKGVKQYPSKEQISKLKVVAKV